MLRFFILSVQKVQSHYVKNPSSGKKKPPRFWAGQQGNFRPAFNKNLGNVQCPTLFYENRI